MLDPRQRKIYLNELRPPEGYLLDSAICTTFTLDLISLLMAPLSMALYEAQDQKEMLQDPIAVLEALRRTSNKIAVFCQHGRIALPSNNTRLISLLEKSVVEVKPHNESGVFHPKTWLLRFTAQHEPTMYRFICLSRNLTFDRSWDTILSMEGEISGRKRGYRVNRPLVDFVGALPKLAPEPVSTNIQSLVDLMAREVALVNFEPPPDVDDFKLLPIGIEGYKRMPVWQDPSRIMIVSPFLSQSELPMLAEYGTNNVLVSRPESLDEIDDEVLQEIEENCEIFIMDQDAAMTEPDEEAASEDITNGLDSFTGLHAKLFIIESGWNARVLSGSANFSHSALEGQNVEFMVELQSKKSKLGIDKFLTGEGESSFRSMLRKYNRAGDLKVDRSIQHKLEKMLDGARSAITDAKLRATVTRTEGELFNISIKASKDYSGSLESVSGIFYPVSYRASSGKSLVELQGGASVSFTGVTPIAITSFIAFEIEAKLEEKSAKTAFVVNIPIKGMPEDRDSRLLHHLISDQKSFIRYLLLILMEGDGKLLTSDILMTPQQEDEEESAKSILGFYLLEELVRAYSRAPEKIDRIDKLVNDLGRTPQGRALFPPGFEDVWKAIKTARGQKETEK